MVRLKNITFTYFPSFVTVCRSKISCLIYVITSNIFDTFGIPYYIVLKLV